jgi:signal transduction histidine kinase
MSSPPASADASRQENSCAGRPVRPVWWRLWTWVTLAHIAFHVPAWAGVIELNRALVTTEINGQVRTETVDLPYHWDQRNPGQQGYGTFTLAFTLTGTASDVWSIYIPKVGNAFEIWLNGVPVREMGPLNQHNVGDYSQVPRLVSLPPSLLQPYNELRVRVRADTGRRGGLSTITLGPEHDVEPIYRSAHQVGTYGPFVVALFSLMVGSLSLVLWATQPRTTSYGPSRRDPLYLHAGVAEMCWSVGVGYVLLEDPPLNWPWWGILPMLMLSIWIQQMLRVCGYIADWHDKPKAQHHDLWMVVLVIVGPLCGWLSLGLGMPTAMTVWYTVMGLSAVAFLVPFMGAAIRSSNWQLRAIALAMLFNILVGFRDIIVFRVKPSYGETTYLRYASVMFGLSLAAVVVMRFRAAVRQAQELQQSMEQRIEQREAQLADSYRQLRDLAEERVRQTERSQILRDMHDGVGAHLSAAIRMLQGGSTDRQTLMQTLQESLDQLKLSIDAMNTPAGDVNALLANLRYRLEPRFRAMGVSLAWQVEPLPEVMRLQVPQMRELQFLLFEALSNALQHAACQQIVVAATAQGEGVDRTIWLSVADDGRGLTPDHRPGHGLRTMASRAQHLRATLDIQSRAAGTAVQLRLPIQPD